MPGISLFGVRGLLELFIVVVLVLWFAWLTRTGRMGFRLGAGRRRERDDALEILRKRYAKGEISEAEFLEKRRFLGGG